MPRTRTNVLDTRMRQGTVTSASRPTTVDQDNYIVEFTLASVDVADPTNTIGLTLEASFDGGTNWVPLVSSVYTGGSTGRNPDGSPNPLLFQQPRIGTVIAPGSLRPTHLRVACDIGRSQLISADLIEDSAAGGR